MEQIGRYQVLEEIARGGMGVVYKARDPAAEHLVAIKLMLRGSFAGEVARKRFQREAQALVKVRHPNVVRLHDYALTAAGAPYMAMELLEGDSLETLLQLQGPLEVGDAVETLTTLCAAVSACHQVGVLHRDLKPDNVLRGRDGTLKLIDFGLVRDSDASLSRSRLSLTGQLLGTPGYWAPEQAKGELDAIGPATDVYGLGAVLFALLTGRSPHEGASLYEVLGSMETPVRAPSSLNPAVPAWLDAVVGRALAADPAQRFATPAELAQALAAPAHAHGLRLWSVVLALGVTSVGVATAAVVATRQGSPRAATTVASPAPSQGGVRDAETRESDVVTLTGAARVSFERGLTLAEADRPGEALQAFAESIHLEPSFAAAHFKRGEARLMLGDPRGAIVDCTEAIRLTPDYGEAYHCRGVAHLQLDHVPQSLADFDQAVRLLPGVARALHNRGALRSAMRDGEGAFADYTAALEIDPTLGQTLRSRGILRIEAGDLPGALAELRRAAEARPGNVYDALWCAVLSGDAGPLVQFSDGDDWGAELARYLLDRVTAEELLRRARDVESEETAAERLCEAHCYIGFKLELGGDPAAAREHYEACVATGVTRYSEFVCAQARLRGGE